MEEESVLEQVSKNLVESIIPAALENLTADNRDDDIQCIKDNLSNLESIVQKTPPPSPNEKSEIENCDIAADQAEAVSEVEKDNHADLHDSSTVEGLSELANDDLKIDGEVESSEPEACEQEVSNSLQQDSCIVDSKNANEFSPSEMLSEIEENSAKCLENVTGFAKEVIENVESRIDEIKTENLPSFDDAKNEAEAIVDHIIESETVENVKEKMNEVYDNVETFLEEAKTESESVIEEIKQDVNNTDLKVEEVLPVESEQKDLFDSDFSIKENNESTIDVDNSKDEHMSNSTELTKDSNDTKEDHADNNEDDKKNESEDKSVVTEVTETVVEQISNISNTQEPSSTLSLGNVAGETEAHEEHVTEETEAHKEHVTEETETQEEHVAEETETQEEQFTEKTETQEEQFTEKTETQEEQFTEKTETQEEHFTEKTETLNEQENKETVNSTLEDITDKVGDLASTVDSAVQSTMSEAKRAFLEGRDMVTEKINTLMEQETDVKSDNDNSSCVAPTAEPFAERFAASTLQEALHKAAESSAEAAVVESTEVKSSEIPQEDAPQNNEDKVKPVEPSPPASKIDTTPKRRCTIL